MEQTSVKPADGWKAYYAATRAIVNVNAEFFDIIRDRSLPAMSRFWLDADYVKCIHASGELFTGYDTCHYDRFSTKFINVLLHCYQDEIMNFSLLKMLHLWF